MERRFILFIALSLGVVLANGWLMSKLNPPKPKPAAAQQAAGQPAEDKPGVEKPAADGRDKVADAGVKPAEAAATKAPAQAAAPAATEPEIAEQWVTLGSADPADPYRMLVTLTNRGAAVLRIELSSPRYRDLDDRSGYLGHLVQNPDLVGRGAVVAAVGKGTPAAKAGLQPGDVITHLNDVAIASGAALNRALLRTKPNHRVTLVVDRKGERLELAADLIRQPLEVVRPEDRDPLSFLMTLQQVDEQKLDGSEKVVDDSKPRELPGVRLRTGNWEIVDPQADAVTFRRRLPELGLEVSKTYRVQPLAAGEIDKPNTKAYHLVFDVAVKNIGGGKHTVAYQLDGPTGLPTEGYWYANKVGWSSWGAVGLRDVVVSFDGRFPEMIECPKIAEEKIGPPWGAEPLSFIGVDAQYFSALLIPQPKSPKDVWFEQSQPLLVHKMDELYKQQNPDWHKLANTTCRLVSRTADLAAGESLDHRFLVFAGPKRPALLQDYGLADTVYYGWFSWVARPMVGTLHVLYGIFGNYGIAIILLTVLVRLCVFPMSRKQALGTVKMAQIQPELKRLQEKYKNDVPGRTKAQQDLFRKHNYNPLSGCLVVFIQLPIFVALYRSLMVDVELRQAPLIAESIRWCSNLAAPDMLLDWSGLWNKIGMGWINAGSGMFGLGPYFNILPIFTIILFLWQQKKMMPPPADEQAAMQQKVMQWMMVFMGILFFKVASGLCLYFIASSLWGMGERQFLPKITHGNEPPPPAKVAATPRRSRR